MTSFTPPAQRPRPTPRRIAVNRIEDLSPSMRRVTFEGAELDGFAWSGPAAHLKLVFPDPQTGVLPAIGPDQPRPATMRTYTPRRFDADERHLAVDFFLHGDGVASTWASRVEVGNDVVVMGPSRGYEIDPNAPWYVLACDETALPAIETLIEALPPAMPVHVFAEIENAREERTLPGSRAVHVHWVTRDAGARQSALAAALATFSWPSGEGRAYVGCEAETMRQIRTMLLEEHGFDRTRITTRGYWRRGASNYPDRDYGDD